jgi:hypothetical protein
MAEEFLNSTRDEDLCRSALEESVTFEKHVDPAVQEILGEPFRFYVKSRRQKAQYLVDLEENECLGECPCWDFKRRFAAHKRSGRPVLEFVRCWHLLKAARVFQINAVRMLSAEFYRQQHGNYPKPGRVYFLKRL